MATLKAKGVSLYNIARAEGGWSFHDDETKLAIAKKVSKSLLCRNAKLTSEERKAKFAYWSKDKPYPDAAKEQISKKMTGMIKSEETRAKMRIAQASIADSKRENMAKVGQMNKGRLPPNTRRVLLDDGTTHESLKKAAEHLSMSSSGLIKRMKKHELGRYIIDNSSEKEEN